MGLVFVLGLSCTQVLGLDGDYHLAPGGGSGETTSGQPTTAGGGDTTAAGGATSSSGSATTGDTGAGTTTITASEQGCWDAGGDPCPVQRLSAGAYFTCALLGDGRVKCWGDNNHGQLGLGDTEPRGDGPGEMGGGLPYVDLGAGQKAVAIAAGALHACALLEPGAVKCWGYNNYGQLGLGDAEDRGDDPGEMGDSLGFVDLGAGQKAVALSAGGGHSCALLESGLVKCWGYGSYGQTGLGDYDNRGDDPGEMGDGLSAVDLGSGQTAAAVVGKGTHSCALAVDGKMKCWGANAYGQLGLGDNQDRGDEPGEMGNSLPALVVDSTQPAVAMTNTPFITCALLLAGGVKCWGQNHLGQLGRGDTETWGDEPDENVFDLSSVSLGTGQKAVAVAAGYSGFGASGGAHVCALLASGGVKCWGANYAGQLGLGDVEHRGDDPGEMGNSLPVVDIGDDAKITDMVTGSDHTCVVLGGEKVKCWGHNEVGELGLGDIEYRGDEPGEMGDSLPTVQIL